MGNKAAFSNQVKLLNIVVPCKIGVQFDDTDILCNCLYLLSHIYIIHTKEDAIYVYYKGSICVCQITRCSFETQ